MLHAMLDTDTCIRVLRDRSKRIGDRFKAEVDRLSISMIVFHELCYGAKLITGNLREFNSVDGLICEDWLA